MTDPLAPSVEWLLLKYTPDLRRNEPRNLAVVLLGVDRELRWMPAADVAGLVGDTSSYEAWIEWLSDKVAAGASPDELCTERVGDAYRVVRSGRVLAGNASSVTIDSLFDELVVLPTDRTKLSRQLRAACLAPSMHASVAMLTAAADALDSRR